MCLSKTEKQVTDKYIQFITAHICNEYIELKNDLPSGFCEKCRSKIRRLESSVNFEPPSASYDMVEFATNIRYRPAMTRAYPECTCRICEIGRKN